MLVIIIVNILVAELDWTNWMVLSNIKGSAAFNVAGELRFEGAGRHLFGPQLRFEQLLLFTFGFKR
jgi:hypothetical protein